MNKKKIKLKSIIQNDYLFTIITMILIIIILGSIKILSNKQQTDEEEYIKIESIQENTYEDSNNYLQSQTQKSNEEIKQEKYKIRNLKGLEPYKQCFIQAEEIYGVDCKLLISIAILESGWGESHYAKANNNIFGWCSGEMKFESVRDCIFHVAEFLKCEYLSEDGLYFNGYEIKDIAICYNENPSLWTEKITEIYNSLEG